MFRRRKFICLPGLALNSENYKEAVAILRDGFGKYVQVLISAHKESLLRINKITYGDS